MKKNFLLLLFCILQTVSYSYEPIKPLLTNTPPIIDGKLDDAIWKDAIPISGFKSFSPDFGKDASERTIAYAAYDSENLYFAFYCYDREPKKI